jgi:hypothetical protein
MLLMYWIHLTLYLYSKQLNSTYLVWHICHIIKCLMSFCAKYLIYVATNGFQRAYPVLKCYFKVINNLYLVGPFFYFLVGSLLHLPGLFFNYEYGSSMFLQNIPENMVLHPRRQHSSQSLLWESLSHTPTHTWNCRSPSVPLLLPKSMPQKNLIKI